MFVTVLPTNSWKAALAARRTCTSRSKRETVTRWRAKLSACSANALGVCVLARDHSTYAAASLTLDPMEWAPLRKSKCNAYNIPIVRNDGMPLKSRQHFR